MKKEYFEPEFKTRILFTELMSDPTVGLSEPEYDTHDGTDTDDSENIGGN